MRFTVYGEDLRPDRSSELIAEEVRDEPGRVYHGVRIYLGPDKIHRPGDDDTSALNLFIPLQEDGKPDIAVLKYVLLDAVDSLDALALQEGLGS